MAGTDPQGLLVHPQPPSQDTPLACWQRWDAAALIRVCDAADSQGPLTAPELAGWRGLAAFMAEDGQALAWLDRAYRGYLDAGQADRACVTAHTALVIGLLDIGAIDGLGEWEARAPESKLVEATDTLSQLWLTLGTVARVPLGQPDTPAASHAAAHLLQALVPPLLPLPEALSPHERLLAASVLIEYHFQVQRFEQFDRLASLVEPPLLFDAAACRPTRARADAAMPCASSSAIASSWWIAALLWDHTSKRSGERC